MKMKMSTQQTLLSVVKSIIYGLEVDAADLKDPIIFYWDKSVQGADNSEEYFNKLNELKNQRRAIKKDIKRFAAIAKELKG